MTARVCARIRRCATPLSSSAPCASSHPIPSHPIPSHPIPQVRNASLLIRSMRFMLEKWPRLVAEYKPAFGSIFEQYIAEYTHWGYCDLDMVSRAAG